MVPEIDVLPPCRCEAGHRAAQLGRKWQNWFWEMGRLRGHWRCRSCNLFWEDVSPHFCPRCDAGVNLIEYAEVPLSNAEHMIIGSADGDVYRPERNDWSLIEVKSMNANSIRLDAPNLVKRHTYEHTGSDGHTITGVDWQKVWNGIRQPFGSHLKQGLIYCYCLGRKEIVFLYEAKFITAYPREFDVKFRRELIEDVLEGCISVRQSLDAGRPPKRPMWAEQKHRRCQGCAFRKTCWAGRARTTS